METSTNPEEINPANKSKNNIAKLLIIAGIFFLLISFIAAIIGVIFYPNLEDMIHFEAQVILLIFILFLAFGSTFLSAARVYKDGLKEQQNDTLITEQEKRVAENPNEPKLAWDLARIKLESYLDRNLSQIKSIYHLSVLAMLIGFGLIIYGSYMSFQKTENIQPALVAAVSGIIVNLIGATFLILYKSTMEQAKDYVNVLERINAVGMSVQIIETIDDKHLQLKEETKAELSKKLIDLYSTK